MKCKNCGNTIEGRRPNSLYCDDLCKSEAKKNRQAERLIGRLNGVSPFAPNQMVQNQPEELRKVERSHFDKVTELKDEYRDKIAELKDLNLRQEFKIQGLESDIKNLESKHSRELDDASKSATREVVQSISVMPGIQSALGNLANGFMSKRESGLAGAERRYSEGEKQIIDAIRKMQPDAQSYLIQMLYVLFAKSNEEQMEIFTSLQAYMMGSDGNEDDI